MNTRIKTTRILGIAFLLQFITSFSSGSFIKPGWFVADNISATMLKIANYPGLLRINILVDMLTALGVIFLGMVLFVTLRKQNEKIALVAAGFYVLEACLLAASRLSTISLLNISLEYVRTNQPEFLLTLGNLALESMDFVGDTLHVLVFGIGGILFYYLLYQSRVVPRWLSLWGLITIFLPLAGTLAVIFGTQLPFIIFLPYVPFEPAIGIWVLLKGVPEI